ncbi:esterase/lipase family protein [Prescottella agglutinans]|uniref:Triacylglycerol lipase n=1 Tax=Prescottella agglutinans TaxID=1644129 RepID=A0ABT6MHI0_9NOCA|nr:alpha/beta fold hydrolase [Prescottella agglutinans]MDH6283773.1 triacylglycerol lipase [Prescottella agglutinans]
MGIPRRLLAASTVAAAMGLSPISGVVANAQTQYPVPSGYLAGLTAQLTHPGQAPPGADDWTCRPTPAHPNPVVLLHGFASTDTLTWQTVSPLLANEGYCVFSTTIGKTSFGDNGGFASVPDTANEISAYIERVRAATGAAKVDIVAHSASGATAFYYLTNLGGADRVDNLVTLGAPFHGSDLDGSAIALRMPGVNDALAAVCAQCSQLAAGSPFLSVLNPDPTRVPAVHFTAVVSRYDEVATPFTTGLLADAPNVHNVVLQDPCPGDTTEHLQLPSDPAAVDQILHALDPERAASCSGFPSVPE